MRGTRVSMRRQCSGPLTLLVGPCSVLFHQPTSCQRLQAHCGFSKGIVFNSLGTNCTHQVNLCVPSGGKPGCTKRHIILERSLCPHLVGFSYYLFLSHLNHLDNLSPFFSLHSPPFINDIADQLLMGGSLPVRLV